MVARAVPPAKTDDPPEVVAVKEYLRHIQQGVQGLSPLTTTDATDMKNRLNKLLEVLQGNG